MKSKNIKIKHLQEKVPNIVIDMFGNYIKINTIREYIFFCGIANPLCTLY